MKHTINIIKIWSDSLNKKSLEKIIADAKDNNIWAIINHNDSLHPNELNNISDKTDNDKNTLYLSRILSEYSDNKVHIKRVIYLTNTHWLLDENWTTVLWWKILWEENKNYYRSFINIDNDSTVFYY